MTDKFIGPALPEHSLGNSPLIVERESNTYFGPKLPPNLTGKRTRNSDDDDEVIGPILPSSGRSSVQNALDERAEILKYEFLLQGDNSSDGRLQREEWMTELPPEKSVNLGLGPRKFKKSYTGDKSNRAGWTETPNDKNKIVEPLEAVDFEMATIARRNEVMDELVKKSSGRNKDEKSLLDLHREKLKRKEKKKKKKSKKEDKPERRPFDREVDLQAHQFDNAQKELIIKKAQLLNSRFSTGKSKYL